MALFSHGLSGSVSEKLPILLLSLVSVLFSVEILSLICRYGRLFSTRHVVLLTSSSVLVLEKAMMQATTTLRRTGLVFASCYLIAVAAIYMGGLVATAVPVFTDISLYLVAVTISLALLIILREE